MKNYLTTAATTALSLSLFTTSAHADGLFDFVDPCYEVRDSFNEHEALVLAAMSAEVAAVSQAEPNEEYREYWFAQKRLALRPIFDELVAPALPPETDLEQAFDRWFQAQVEGTDSDELDRAITNQFRSDLLTFVEQGHGEANANLVEQRTAIDSQCQMDFGSQAERVIVTEALRPIATMEANFEAAESEANIVTQTFRAATGISAQAIQENGLAGGSGSEVRRTGRAVNRAVNDIGRALGL